MVNDVCLLLETDTRSVGLLLWGICVMGEVSLANGFLIADMFVESIHNKWPDSNW